jgi:glycosyltransferase 2 family protein
LPLNPSPAATHSSTVPSPGRRSWLGALKALILVAALIWVGFMVAEAIRDVRHGNLQLRLQPAWLAMSAGFVLLAYLVLIKSWLYIVTVLDGRTLPFLVGARIWFISNLGTLLPGRVWGILQMGAMSAEQGIGAVAAGTASVINAAVNIACGMAVGVIAGTPIFAAYLGDLAWMAWVAAALAIIGVCLLPVLLPYVFRVARERFHVSAPVERPPARVLVVSAVANIVAWVLYGAAFMYLARGILGITTGTLIQHTAAFATSYVLGYLAIVVPAGIGVREAALQKVLLIAGLATAPQAVALSLVSRLWLLIIQVLPALLFLAYRRRSPDEKSAAG